MSEKVNTTLSIDKQAKQNFKVECTLNGVDMSETTENLWNDYVELSRALRSERENKNG